MTNPKVGRVRRTRRPAAWAKPPYPRIVPKDAAHVAKLKDRTLTKLYNERTAWGEILERLLALNLERAAPGQRPGKAAARRAQRGRAEDEML